MTFAEWLLEQPASVQDEILGPQRGKMFRDGDVELSVKFGRNAAREKCRSLEDRVPWFDGKPMFATGGRVNVQRMSNPCAEIFLPKFRSGGPVVPRFEYEVHNPCREVPLQSEDRVHQTEKMIRLGQAYGMGPRKLARYLAQIDPRTAHLVEGDS